ncbi:glycoside hydrolase family 38 N-terminal domain-containing protein [Paractinoplanes durhamensis]|uniref:glycoside hydrolase family 38 N-terminal domain-containing protein n=1 Tax=Paractinoplanes durhamensis TaxID=113563 RepID=UPI003625CA01
MRITVEDTDLFIGPAAAPRQVVRVTLTATEATPPIRVRVEGPTVRTPEPTATGAFAAGEERVVEVGVQVAAPAPEGSVHRITVLAEHDGGRATVEGTLRAAETGWTMWMISHFHYDPVWWNTQRGFTELWQQLPDVPGADRLRNPSVRTAFDLVHAHLDAARMDEDYRFVLAEIDYLKPYWDVFPQDRADLRRMLREGRVELVGGMYNEPNTNLTHPESTIRNTALGVGYQRDVLGGDPQSAWMLDVFGHDPSFPGLMADAGLTSSVWARGPFHNNGIKRHTGDVTRMQFPSEFEWISPSGLGLPTAYLANHYVAGWDMERRETLAEAMDEAYAQYRDLRKVAATRNVFLPVGHDHNIPSRWCTEIHREWAKRYVWPRFVMGVPRDYFAAVRAERPVLSPQTRDMNPVYTGKDVSYIDTKQAQRAIEGVVLDAERLGTLAALLGTRYPAELLDKAWRLLAYGAHHDAVTGTESDQVYLDLLAGWREAYELAATARRRAIGALAARADTAGPGRAVLVANTLSWPRDDVARIKLDYPAPGPPAVAVTDEHGRQLPAVAEAVTRHEDGTVAAITLSVAADDVPALGYRTWHVVPADEDTPAGGPPTAPSSATTPSRSRPARPAAAP